MPALPTSPRACAPRRPGQLLRSRLCAAGHRQTTRSCWPPRRTRSPLYQALDPEFRPFSSKFDQRAAGPAGQFSGRRAARPGAVQRPAARQLRELPQQPAARRCHSGRLFTDFGYHALGVPRNRAQQRHPATRRFSTLACAVRSAATWRRAADWCGRFRTPSLRNVARTAPYFHNARFNTLEEVLAFYATRDTDPAALVPAVGGRPAAALQRPAAALPGECRAPPAVRPAARAARRA